MTVETKTFGIVQNTSCKIPLCHAKQSNHVENYTIVRNVDILMKRGILYFLLLCISVAMTLLICINKGHEERLNKIGFNLSET